MDKKQQFSIWYVLLAVIAVLSMQMVVATVTPMTAVAMKEMHADTQQ